MDLYNLNKITSFAVVPENKDDFENWVLQKDVVDYLENEAKDDYIIIYASLPYTFIHSVFIPKNIELNEDAIDDLKGWNYNPYSSWGIEYSSNNDVCIVPPLSGSGSKILSDGEQIVFGRSFEGINSNNSYYELNQKLAHILEVHYIEERKSWCKLDHNGDMVDVFKILKISGLPKNDTGIIICAKKEELSDYINIENLTLIRMFDFSRYKPDSITFLGRHGPIKDRNIASVYISLSVTPGIGSYSRGFQHIDLSISKEQIAKRFWEELRGGEHKKYCSYIAYDWKSKTVSTISCNPVCWSNQFTKSDLPYDITPAFFRPEVLRKYKIDGEKYRLRDRSVSCRSAWSLETFDVNSAGQVHTYLVYLSRLPYEEQLHWKQYNEKPKALLSERAFKTDIKGERDETYNPLLSLKQKLRNIHDKGGHWWILRSEDVLDKVQPIYTTSKDEWADELLRLDQLLIEGLEEKWLRKKAKELGCNPDVRLRPLKLLEAILVALGFEEEHARNIMTPLHVVHKLRSIEAHTSGREAEIERKNALREHGSFKKHFEKICGDCDESIGIITKALKK